MKRKEAEQLVIAAAQSWAHELVEYIIPDAVGQDAESYEASSARLEQALAIVTGDLEPEDFHKKDAGEWGKCPF